MSAAQLFSEALLLLDGCRVERGEARLREAVEAIGP